MSRKPMPMLKVMQNNRVVVMAVNIDQVRTIMSAIQTAIPELRVKSQPLDAEWTALVSEVCKHAGVSTSDLLDGSRFRKVVQVRSAIVVAWIDKTGEPWTTLAKRLGRDHSSLMTAYHKAVGTIYADERELNEKARTILDEILKNA